MDDDTIKRLSLKLALDMRKTFEADSEWLFAFARACYAEGQRDAEKRIAELEREVNEQARRLGISGSTEARLLARVGELERERNLAFEMSKCECEASECCANLVRWSDRVAELERDAARYRWLRLHGGDGQVTGKDGYGGYELLYGATLDEAVDAAMRKECGE